MSKRDVEQDFIRDIATHKMTVMLNHGLYRHLKFRAASGTSNHWFEIVTWPGMLTLHGDMGTWSFSRVTDMFNFFRSDKLEINASYWAEKLQGGVNNGRDSSKVWSEETFKSEMLSLLDNYDFTTEQRAEITEALEEQVFRQETKYEILLAARDFSHQCLGPSWIGQRRKFTFDSCDLPQGLDYAYHFIWCLYGIVWAIQQYDAIPKDELAGKKEDQHPGAPQ